MQRGLALGGVLLGLSACGGGGGAQSPQSTPTPPQAAAAAVPETAVLTPTATAAVSTASSSEFARNGAGFALIGLAAAHDAGLTGKGVTVGVVDDGLDAASGEFAGRISPLSKDFGHDEALTVAGVYAEVARSGLAGPYTDHGTAVGGVVAAARDGRGMVGVAPEASLAMLRTDISRPGNGGEYFADAVVANAIAYAADNRIGLLNISLSRVGRSDPVAAATERYAATGGLIVFAAGNSGGADPDAIANITAANRGATIFVGGLAASGDTLDPRSNRAGALADRFLVAPMEVAVLQPDGSVAAAAGTSFAAPMVTGAAALLLQKWPQLSGAQAGEILLATAKDLGDKGTDAVFGRGLLDIAAATAPVDPKIVAAQKPTSIAAAAVVLPRAFGPTAVRAALADVVVTDRWGRDFHADLGGRVVRASALGSLRQAALPAEATAVALPGVQAAFGWRASPGGDGPAMRLTTARFAARAGGLDLAFASGASGDGLAVPLAGATGGIAGYAPQADRRAGLGWRRAGIEWAGGGGATAGSLSWRPGGWTLRASAIRARGSLFGAASSGALAFAKRTRTLAIEARRDWALAGGWTASLDAGLGRTRVTTADGSLFTGAGPLLTTHAAAELRGPLAGGGLALSLAQPLTVERGRATLMLPVRYDLTSRSVRVEARDVSLAGDRPLLLGARYERALGTGTVSLAATRDLTAGETAALFSLRTRF